MAARKIPPEKLVEGTAISVATARDKKERVDWDAFARDTTR